MGIKQRGLSQDLEPPNPMGLSPKSYGFVPQILWFFPQIPSGLSCSFVKCLGISTSWRWLAASPTGPMDTQLDHFRLPIFRRSRSLGWPRNLVQKVILGIWNHPCLVNMSCRSEVGTVWSILPVTQHTVNNPFFLMELYGIRPSTGHVQL